MLKKTQNLIINKKSEIFDLDGTLTDTAEGITNSVMHALTKQGVLIADMRELYRLKGLAELTELIKEWKGLKNWI